MKESTNEEMKCLSDYCEKENRKWLKVAVVFLLFGILLGGSTVYIAGMVDDTGQQLPSKTVNIHINDTADLHEIHSRLYEEVSDSVVAIHIDRGVEGPGPLSQGSGFVYDEAGHIITNEHVVDGATRIDVVFSNGEIRRAELVGKDANSDIAVIRVENFPDEEGFEPYPLPMGNSTRVKTGDWVVAIGNPFGLEGSMTQGIVSGTGRTMPTEEGYTIPDVIQSDSGVNPGNSGGPLLSIEGEVIGVVRAKRAEHIGLAISSNQAERVAESIIEEGKYTPPWLGVEVSTVAPEAAEYMGLDIEVTRRPMIINVQENSPAHEAELQGSERITIEGIEYWVGGDIITKVDGVNVTSVDGLITEVCKYGPGESVTLTIIRDGEFAEVDVTLGERPENS